MSKMFEVGLVLLVVRGNRCSGENAERRMTPGARHGDGGQFGQADEIVGGDYQGELPADPVRRSRRGATGFWPRWSLWRHRHPPGQARFRHKKLRNRGLAKNTAQLYTLIALANPVIVKKNLLAQA
jgi:IS5 family transposase